MSGTTDGLDLIIFVALPAVAMVLAIVGFIHRYRNHDYSIVSPSSQFLEARRHFWALVPFHYGVLIALMIHLLAFLFPGLLLSWNANPIRLYLLETIALSAGLLTLTGLCTGLARRLTSVTFRRLTRGGDWLLLLLILIQVLTGVLVAIFHRWGSPWFAAAATPYLRSLLFLSPDLGFVAAAPLLIKIHIANAFILLAYLPYSKLVHAIVVPLFYLWRAPITYRWRTRR